MERHGPASLIPRGCASVRSTAVHSHRIEERRLGERNASDRPRAWMPDSGHIDRTKINAGLARRGVVTIPTNQVPTAGLLPFPRTFPPHRPLKARAVDVRRCEPPSAATSAGCSPLSTQASLHAVTRGVGELPPIASPRPPPPPRSAPRLPRIAYHRSQQSQSQPAGANQCGLIRSPICGFDSDTPQVRCF